MRGRAGPRYERGENVPVRSLVSYSIDRVEVLDPEGNVDESLMPALPGDRIQRLYEHMVLTRQFDERMFKLQRQGRLGTFARVAGQEGAHVGAAFALRADDWLVPSFRETGALLLRGIPMAQLLQFWSGDERGGAFPRELRTLPIAVPVGTRRGGSSRSGALRTRATPNLPAKRDPVVSPKPTPTPSKPLR